MADDRMLNFAYGSNMCTRYLREVAPSAEPVTTAVLPNFHLEFRMFSEKLQGGISTILPKPGHLVHGVLFSITVEDYKTLDVRESVLKGLYVRNTYLVLDRDGIWTPAELFTIVTPQGPFEPAGVYIDDMLEGAREHNLPAEYLQEIESYRA